MAKVIAVGEPVNDAERRVIAHLRDHLPDDYTIVHNFEIRRNRQFFEVDLAVIAPHSVYLVDVKGVHGLVEVHGRRWYPERRAPYASPLPKLREHAKVLKGLVTASQPTRRDLSNIWVDAAVVLAEDDAIFQDQGGQDAPSVTALARSAAFFKNSAHIPSGFATNIRPLHAMTLRAIQGAARPRNGPLRFGSWEVTERLGGTDAYTEYRGVNMNAGRRGGRVLLRAYAADPYLPDAEREQQRFRISNAFTALSQMPSHRNFIGVRDLISTEAEDRLVLVTEDVPGQALRLHIDKPALALTLDQKLQMAAELLEALAHAHEHQVVHRNITPGTLLLGTDGHLRVGNFEFSRVGTDRSLTLAGEIIDDLEPEYQAPETFREPANASPASDVFSAGLVLYEMFTGQRPFGGPTELFDQSGVFPILPSQARSELSARLDDWLQGLCAFDPDQRPSARQAAADLAALRMSQASQPESVEPAAVLPQRSEPIPGLDYGHLAPGTVIATKYEVQQRLGRGGFGVVYKVIDTLGDVPRAMKLILTDRHSPLERLKKEYQTLLRVPEHPNVVRVFDAQFPEPGGVPPYIVFEFIDGQDIAEMVQNRLFSLEDALDLARQVTEGLVHLHRHGIYHCDVKPRNLMWTRDGVKIIDFNVSVNADKASGRGGGSPRYLPPDLDRLRAPQPAELADRDLYAVGVTLYEALTGRYPWDAAEPVPDVRVTDPRELPGLGDLSPELADLMLRAIAPRRGERFESASELQAALRQIRHARRPTTEPTGVSISTSSADSDEGIWEVSGEDSDAPVPANTNPHVASLVTLYSQSASSNAGTRGLDEFAAATYVATALDEKLAPALLRGEFRLVLITGNAGDGKTAFLQRLEQQALEKGAAVDKGVVNGSRFRLDGHSFLTNYDGSQDEGERSNDEVLDAFLAPFAGRDPGTWPDGEVRLIAINEGRLVDFLTANAGRFPLLASVAGDGLRTGAPQHGVAVINLNLRSVVHNPWNSDNGEDDDSIFGRTLRRLTHERFWEACDGCDLRDRCYARHNARTFQDPVAGPAVAARLRSLYTLTHLRGLHHITLRDMRSALSFMLVSGRDCQQIHDLYQSGDRDRITQGFYFNSWMGGDQPTRDRMLTLLSDMDMGAVADPRLDRNLDFVSPGEDRTLFRFDTRGAYDRAVLSSLYGDLPRDFSGRPTLERGLAHQRYLSMARRRAFFERRDDGWGRMLPYRSAERMIRLVAHETEASLLLPEVLAAINKGEGLHDPSYLGELLALQVREVERGSVKSYRVFPAERFSIAIADAASRARFVEHMPSGLILRYEGATGTEAELLISLDVLEMLERLNQGYLPSIEERRGYYLSLAVFKNTLGSEPYRELLLTVTGHDFYRITRHGDGRLEMSEPAPVPARREIP